MGSNANIYDSWRSQRQPPPSTDEFYDSHDPYNDVQLPHKSYRPQQNHYSQYQYDSQYTMDEPAYPYPINASNYNNSRKYYRDYDPNF